METKEEHTVIDAEVVLSPRLQEIQQKIQAGTLNILNPETAAQSIANIADKIIAEEQKNVFRKLMPDSE